MNIGKNITAFRKTSGMTQEELANRIGVSAQAVSKWETGVSMPDIMLLPTIADVFGITVDDIYTGKQSAGSNVHYSFNELPELIYREILSMDSYAWQYNTEEERKNHLAELRENLERDASCMHFSLGYRGGAVFATSEYALVHRTFGTSASLEIMNSTSAVPVLSALTDEYVGKMFCYLITNQKKIFTTAAIAKKLDMTEEECRVALNKMTAANLLYCKEVEGETELPVYSVSADNTKALFVCMILRLAEQISDNKWFFGYRGAYLPVDEE